MSQSSNLLRYSLLASAATSVGAPGAALAQVDITTLQGNYYVAFVNSAQQTYATSTDASYYNGIVQSGSTVNGSILPTSTYQAIVSTPTVSALSNIGCTSGACLTSTPIYEVVGLDGSTPLVLEVADNLTDFFAGTMVNALSYDQTGTQKTGYNYVWTGTNNSGLAATGNELGSADPVFGWASAAFTSSFPGNLQIDDSTAAAGAAYNSLYGISAVLTGTSGTIIPEPASAALLAVGAGLLGVMRRRRKAA